MVLGAFDEEVDSHKLPAHSHKAEFKSQCQKNFLDQCGATTKLVVDVLRDVEISR